MIPAVPPPSRRRSLCFRSIRDYQQSNLGKEAAARGDSEREIAMSEAEKRTMLSLADFCPDFRDLMGPTCSATLDRGCKIELEAVMDKIRSRTP
jgi:hypothetical protein